MKSIIGAFRAFSTLKQAIVMILFLFTLWGGFKGYVYVKVASEVAEKQEAVKKASKKFYKKVDKDVKASDSVILGIPVDDLNWLLCGGECPTKDTIPETPLLIDTQQNNSTGAGQGVSTSNEQRIETNNIIK